MKRWIRIHAWAFGISASGLTMANIYTGFPWWTFWPVAIWSFVFCLHYFTYRAFTIDDEWVQERAFDLRDKSYDYGHIQDIERRIVEQDFSVQPASEDPTEKPDPKNTDAEAGDAENTEKKS